MENIEIEKKFWGAFHGKIVSIEIDSSSIQIIDNFTDWAILHKNSITKIKDGYCLEFTTNNNGENKHYRTFIIKYDDQNIDFVDQLLIKDEIDISGYPVQRTRDLAKRSYENNDFPSYTYLYETFESLRKIIFEKILKYLSESGDINENNKYSIEKYTDRYAFFVILIFLINSKSDDEEFNDSYTVFCSVANQLSISGRDYISSLSKIMVGNDVETYLFGIAAIFYHEIGMPFDKNMNLVIHEIKDLYFGQIMNSEMLIVKRKLPF